MSPQATMPRRHSAMPHSRRTCRPNGGATVGVVRAAGELDLAATPALRARLMNALELHPGGVVVDLSQVTFADCRALGTMIAARNRAAALGRPLKLRGTPPPVARLLKATGTQALFPQDA